MAGGARSIGNRTMSVLNAQLGNAPVQRKPLRRKVFFRWKRAAGAMAGLALIAACILSYRWHQRTRGPDPATANLNDITRFIASDQYRQMYQWQRRAYLDGLIARMNNESFATLAALIFHPTPETRAAIENVKKEPDADELSGSMLRAFLEKFYQQPKSKRDAYMLLMAASEKLDKAKRPAHIGIPARQDLAGGMKLEMARMMAHQTPRGMALTAQFLLDRKQSRRLFGLTD